MIYKKRQLVVPISDTYISSMSKEDHIIVDDIFLNKFSHIKICRPDKVCELITLYFNGLSDSEKELFTKMCTHGNCGFGVFTIACMDWWYGGFKSEWWLNNLHVFRVKIDNVKFNINVDDLSCTELICIQDYGEIDSPWREFLNKLYKSKIIELEDVHEYD